MRARRRRDAVLDRMAAAGMLKPAAAAAAKRAPLGAIAETPAGPTGIFLLETARQELERAVGAAAVRDGGLDVYTTMDLTMQRHAERGVATGLAALERRHRWLRNREPPLEASFVILDLRDGAVRALVGGRDFPRRPFNRAVAARRQAGSTFKPLVYLTAFRQDPARFTATTLLEDRPLTLRSGGDLWEPANYDQQFHGLVTIRSALERSLNVPTVRLAQAVGIDAVAATATSAGWSGELPRVPALALGAADTTLMEIAGLYAAFPRLGAAVTPYVVRGAVGRDGALMDRDSVAMLRRAPTDRRAFDAESAYLVHALLEGVVDRGTARRLRRDGFTGPLAGKTGTTNDYRDAWYVGYSPDLLGADLGGFRRRPARQAPRLGDGARDLGGGHASCPRRARPRSLRGAARNHVRRGRRRDRPSRHGQLSRHARGVPRRHRAGRLLPAPRAQRRAARPRPSPRARRAARVSETALRGLDARDAPTVRPSLASLAGRGHGFTTAGIQSSAGLRTSRCWVVN